MLSGVQTHSTVESIVRKRTVHVIEHDRGRRLSMSKFLLGHGFAVVEYEGQEQSVLPLVDGRDECAIISADYPGIDLSSAGIGGVFRLPVVFVSQRGDVRTGVDAMKSGAVDFLLMPLDHCALLRAVNHAFEIGRRDNTARQLRDRIAASERRLTLRERQVFHAVTSGLMNKEIAYSLGLSEITVKVHRGRMMKKMNSRTLPDLVRKFDILHFDPDNMTTSS